MYRVRRLVESDLASCLSLVEQLGYRCTLCQLQARFQYLERLETEVLLCAVSQHDKVVALIHLTQHRPFVEEASLRVSALVVDAEYRGKGVGRKLIDAAEAYAKEHGFASISLSTNALRKDAPLFYERLGFQLKKQSLRLEKRLSVYKIESQNNSI